MFNAKLCKLGQISAILLALRFGAEPAPAQSFVSSDGDVLVGFRKQGGNYELVVNIGSVTNFLAMQPGATSSIQNFTPAQLSAAFSSYNNLQWSVFGSFYGDSAWHGFPSHTYWITRPRTAVNTQSASPARMNDSSQGSVSIQIISVGIGASSISMGQGSTNSNNNSVLVRESVGDSSALTAFIGDPTLDPYYGDFNGTLPFSVENKTPVTFTSAARSDFYQSCSSGTIDPITGQSGGNAYFVGFFDFNTNGTMTFTRASTNAPAVTPPAPSLAVSRSGNLSTISFLSTNNATYTLIFTNAGGLTAPASTWPSLPGKLTGNNSVLGFQDMTTDADRWYRVIAQ